MAMASRLIVNDIAVGPAAGTCSSLILNSACTSSHNSLALKYGKCRDVPLVTTLLHRSGYLLPVLVYIGCGVGPACNLLVRV